MACIKGTLLAEASAIPGAAIQEHFDGGPKNETPRFRPFASPPGFACFDLPRHGHKKRCPAHRIDFFWSSECPHCHNARPFQEKLAREDTGLTIRSYNMHEDLQYFELYREMAAVFGQEPMAVPAFFVGKEMIVGYDNEQGKGAEIVRAIQRARGDDGGEPSTKTFLDVPILGRLDAQRLSLPALTLLIGFLDAFNPCAFFVLLFLLSLVGHARNRGRILLIGGVFVATSGIVYFGFMAAWFNAFLLFGEMSMLTRASVATASFEPVTSVWPRSNWSFCSMPWPSI